MKRIGFGIAAVLFLIIVMFGSASAQGPRSCVSEPCGSTAGFTYQGQLQNASGPVNATCSFGFTLWDSASGGIQVGPAIPQTLVISGGYFTSAPLDFGAGAFNGSARYLQVGVQCPGDSAATTLSRQLLTPAPYALYALNANSAANFSGLLSGDVSGTQIGTSVNGLRGIPISATMPSNGQVLQYVGSQWTPATLQAGNGWGLTGNAGTDPNAQFLGTTDNVTLTLRVNNRVGLRLVPNGTNVLNVIGGDGGNGTTSGVQGATISGGGGGTASNRVTDNFGVVGGGISNRAGDNAGTNSDKQYATVGGGNGNTAAGTDSTVAGGFSNHANGNDSTVAGGSANYAEAVSTAIGGGANNVASGNYSVVGGGLYNTASGYYATVPGGYLNSATNSFTFASGRRAKAIHAGSFVWADSTDADLYTSASNQFLVRATGGVTFFTNSTLTTGMKLPAGSGSWATVSDKNVKANFRPVALRAILDQVAGLPIQTWNYISQDDSIRHIGPTAQDFYAAFQVGEDDKHISTVDADGVALAAIQGLNQIVQEKDGEIQKLKSQVSDLESQKEKQQTQLDKLQAQVSALEASEGTPSLPLSQLGLGVGMVVMAVGILGRRIGEMR